MLCIATLLHCSAKASSLGVDLGAVVPMIGGIQGTQPQEYRLGLDGIPSSSLIDHYADGVISDLLLTEGGSDTEHIFPGGAADTPFNSNSLAHVPSLLSLSTDSRWDQDHGRMLDTLSEIQNRIRLSMSQKLAERMNIDPDLTTRFVDLIMVLVVNSVSSVSGDTDLQLLEMIAYLDELPRHLLNSSFEIVQQMSQIHRKPNDGFLAPNRLDTSPFSFEDFTKDLVIDLERTYGNEYANDWANFYRISDELVSVLITVNEVVHELKVIYTEGHPEKVAIRLMNLVANQMGTSEDVSLSDRLSTVRGLAFFCIEEAIPTVNLIHKFHEVYDDLWSTDDSYLFWTAAKRVDNDEMTPMDAAIRTLMQLDDLGKMDLLRDQSAEDFLPLSSFGTELDTETSSLLHSARTLSEKMQLTFQWVEGYRKDLGREEEDLSRNDY